MNMVKDKGSETLVRLSGSLCLRVVCERAFLCFLSCMANQEKYFHHKPIRVLT